MNKDPSSAVAVIKTGGKQYLVQPGNVIKVERLPETTRSLPDLLSGQLLPVEIIGTWKQKKIRVLKFRHKTRYKRRYGHRQVMTQVRVGNFGKI